MSGLQVQIRAALAVVPNVVEKADFSERRAAVVALHEHDIQRVEDSI